jgi:hypothetical protein
MGPVDMPRDKCKKMLKITPRDKCKKGRTQIGMFRPIRMDHANCLQVAIKSIQFQKKKEGTKDMKKTDRYNALEEKGKEVVKREREFSPSINLSKFSDFMSSNPI